MKDKEKGAEMLSKLRNWILVVKSTSVENPEGGFSTRLLAAKKRVTDKEDKRE